MRIQPSRLVAFAGILGLLAVIPQLVPVVYVNVISRAAVFGIIALSMNILVGYAGQASLGHAAFLGVGGFASGYALSELGMPFGAALRSGRARRHGGRAHPRRCRAPRERPVPGARHDRVRAVRAGDTVQHPLPHRRWRWASRAAAVSVLGRRRLHLPLHWRAFPGAYLDWRLLASRPGRAIQAFRDDERVAASWGIDVTGHKLMAFVISGAIAGIGGALFASIEQIVSKEDFGLSLSITFLLMTVVGGAGNRWGVVQGGILFAVLPTLLDRTHANFHIFPFTELTATWEPAIGAILLLLTLTMFPGGIAQQQGALLSWLGGGPFKRDPDAHTPAQGGGMGARP